MRLKVDITHITDFRGREMTLDKLVYSTNSMLAFGVY